VVAGRTSGTHRFELVDGPLPPGSDPDASPPTSDRTGSLRTPSALIVLVSAIVLVMVAAFVLPHSPSDAPGPPPEPVPSPSTSAPPGAGCDLALEACRVTAAERWRNRTAAIVRERLDPENAYFTGHSYGVSSLYTTGSRLDALALDVYRLNGGGTEVFIQIAKTRADAVRCGQITRHRCTGQRFMDGNRFSMTTTPGVAQGIEVQHSPAGTYVITIAARNTTGGRPLELNNGDLIAVAQDPRLEPPPS
jgi:hypothetical protein